VHELADLLREPMDDARADEAPPRPEIATSRPGDLWICGEHRILCGDSTKLKAIESVLDGGLADMVFGDPPYSVSYVGKTARRLTIKNDDLGAGFYDFLLAACGNLLAVTKGAIYICMSSSELHTLFRAFTDAGGHWSTFIIWAKHHFTLGRSDYQRMYEPILYGWRDGTQHFWCGARDQGDVWSINRPMANLEHPTMKPVELVERAVRNSSKSRDTVLDPFGGSAGANLPPIPMRFPEGERLIVAHEIGRVDEMAQSWDCSFKDLETSDYVVGQVWGRLDCNFLLLDQVRARMDCPATVKGVREMSKKWPACAAKLIEDKANGSAVIQMLTNQIAGILSVNPQGGKIARASAISPLIEAGNVFLPHPHLFPWVNDFIEECVQFPNGAHDDQVDAMTQMILRWHMAPPQERLVLWSELLGEDYRERESSEWFRIGRY
jgi:predicted phage terminase large subunit-like protein